MAQERLQKIMAEAGIGSRRHCEEMILDGEVKVNGRVVDKLPVIVDSQTDIIVVRGRKLLSRPKVYYLLHKPKRVVCTNSDPQGRRCAIDLLKGVRERVYPVGRLDADSTGLLLLTNDGELANQLTHPRYGVHKTYLVQIDGYIAGEDIDRLKKGILIKQGKASMEKVVVVRRGPRESLLEITLREGRNRQIRVMLRRLGYKVKKLTRVRMGKLTLRGLGAGHFRPLTKIEASQLQQLAAQSGKSTYDLRSI